MFSSFADVYLDEYRGHLEGADPSPKLLNNVGSKMFRIRRFLGYMSVGQSNLASLAFINQTKRMRAWLNSLKQSKISDPTVHHYLKNVAQFLAYVAQTPPPTCRLSRTVMVGLQREIKAMIRSVRRSVVVHEVKVKQAKHGRLIPKATLRQCVATAKLAIPDILGKFLTSSHPSKLRVPQAHLTLLPLLPQGNSERVQTGLTYGDFTATWSHTCPPYTGIGVGCWPT